jgi:hypothetical protein
MLRSVALGDADIVLVISEVSVTWTTASVCCKPRVGLDEPKAVRQGFLPVVSDFTFQTSLSRYCLQSHHILRQTARFVNHAR